MKPIDSDDPMELRGTQCEGNPDYMIDCVIEEYLRMGWGASEIARLFESPLYPPLHHLWRTRGPEAVRGRIERAAERCGVFRFRTRQAPESAELVSISPLEEGGWEP